MHFNFKLQLENACYSFPNASFGIQATYNNIAMHYFRSRQLSVRRRPSGLKLMCTPGRPIRCQMVSVGRWRDRGSVRHRAIQRARIKRKPEKFSSSSIHNPTSWSSWKKKQPVKEEEAQIPHDQWKPLNNNVSVKGSAKQALKEIKNEIKKQNQKQIVDKESWRPMVNKEGRLNDVNSLQGQMVRLGEEGKILTVKGAQISIFPKQKTNKNPRTSRMFFI